MCVREKFCLWRCKRERHWETEMPPGRVNSSIHCWGIWVDCKRYVLLIVSKLFSKDSLINIATHVARVTENIFWLKICILKHFICKINNFKSKRLLFLKYLIIYLSLYCSWKFLIKHQAILLTIFSSVKISQSKENIEYYLVTNYIHDLFLTN